MKSEISTVLKLVMPLGWIVLCGCGKVIAPPAEANASSSTATESTPGPSSPSSTPSASPSPSLSPSPSPTPSPSPVPSASPAPSPRPSNAANLVVCPGANTVPGLDVSDYDPGTQWGVVASSGNHFAFIKATEGVTFTNDLFVSDWPAAQNAGLIRGAYHFFHPGDDPVQQAQFYLKTIGTLSASDLPPMLDWETTDGVSSAQQIANAKTWLTLVEAATGKTPIIYVDPSFWNALGNPVDFVQYPLFIAEYDVSCPQVPPPWSDWTFWQKQIGPIPGVQSAQADIDVFNGALQLLEQFGLVQ